MTAEPVERDTSEADMAMFIALVRFMVEAAEKLDIHWESDAQLDPDITNRGYPFQASFDEVFIDMQNWLRLLENPVDRHGVVVSVMPSPDQGQPAKVMVKWEDGDVLTKELYIGDKGSPGRVRTGLYAGCVYDDEEDAVLVRDSLEEDFFKKPAVEYKVTKKFKEGDRVRFVKFHDVCIHPFNVIIPVGSLGTVKDIAGVEGTEAWVELDTYNDLDDWDNCIVFSVDDQEHGTYMDKVLEKAEEGAVEKVVTEFRCPSCHSADLSALVPHFSAFAVRGVRHGRVITGDSYDAVDHPDQDEQRFVCHDCGHEWVDNSVPVGWVESHAYKFEEEDYSKAYDKLCRAMANRDDVTSIRMAAEDLAKAAKALRK